LNIVIVSLDVSPGPKVKFSKPFYCKISGSERIPRQFVKARVDSITKLKNDAMEEALTKFPEATHVAMVESYYLGQTKSVEKMIELCSSLNDPNIILGAPVWVYTVHEWFRRCIFYDSWACPELKDLRRSDSPTGLVQVSSVGSAIIFPVWVWRKFRFANPNFPEKIYYNWLCEKSGLPVLIDLSTKFERCTINGVNLTRFSWFWRVSYWFYLNSIERLLRRRRA
jgi:hypothetical protein